MSGAYRHGRTYCQATGCRARAVQAVVIDLGNGAQLHGAERERRHG